MTKKERETIRKAIDYLMSDECMVTEAVGLLCPLVGLTYPASEARGDAISIFKLMERHRRHPPT